MPGLPTLGSIQVTGPQCLLPFGSAQLSFFKKKIASIQDPFGWSLTMKFWCPHHGLFFWWGSTRPATSCFSSCIRSRRRNSNLSRINFLGPSFFRNKRSFPKKSTTSRRTRYTWNISRINFGTMGANISLDKVPVAKVLFISLQVSNKFRSEKLHTFLWLQPQCGWIFFHGTHPLNFENTKVGPEWIS